MKFIKQKIEGLMLIENHAHIDQRGLFYRNFCLKELKKNLINLRVCQGNVSINDHKYTLRGFHYQKKTSKESKILTPIKGKIYNVVIDLRKKSKSFLQSVNIELSAEDQVSLFVPSGCANAFMTLENNTIIQYYMGDFFSENTYSGFRYNDPYFKIKWPNKPRIISKKDTSYEDFKLKNI